MKKILAAIKSIIVRFSYENLRNETHVELHTSVDSLIMQYTPEELGIKALYDVYKPLFEDEVTALDVIRRSELTAQIAALDQERDRLFRGLADSVKSNLNHFDAAKRTAAQKIEVVLERYGNIAAKTLDDETAAIEDLYRELQKTENAACVATLDLTMWLSKLVETSRSLENLMMQRYEEVSKRPNIHMRSTRKEVDKAFRGILDLLEALVRVKGSNTNKDFIAELNAIMERYKNILAQEEGRRLKL
jgi:paraquat-inducible protein B